MRLNVLEHGHIYDNPVPHVCSRHGYFPGLCVLPNGDVLAIFMLGEAFEAEDLRPHVTRSSDNGRTWTAPRAIGAAAVDGVPVNDSVKPLLCADGSILATGYRFYRDHTGMGMANPETNGVQRAANISMRSADAGETWSEAKVLDLGLASALENSGPAIRLSNGDLIAGGPAMPLWDGTKPDGADGRLIRSTDGGETWSLDSTYFSVPGRALTPYETRFCELSPGRVMAIAWAFDLEAGCSLTNNVSFSEDAGKTWGLPLDTGVKGQASNLHRLDADTVLSVHCQREEGDIGLYARIVDVSGNGWREVAHLSVWDRATKLAVSGYGNMSAIRFGQPSITPVADDRLLVAHWAVENGQGRILTHRLGITPAATQ